MNDNDNERFKTIEKLINDHGYPIPCYCQVCNKPLGFYFKTGLGRWDGKSSAYCEKCGKEINDSSKNH
jgi:hypothetical protein